MKVFWHLRNHDCIYYHIYLNAFSLPTLIPILLFHSNQPIELNCKYTIIGDGLLQRYLFTRTVLAVESKVFLMMYFLLPSIVHNGNIYILCRSHHIIFSFKFNFSNIYIVNIRNELSNVFDNR